jgi:hypothetical protein
MFPAQGDYIRGDETYQGAKHRIFGFFGDLEMKEVIFLQSGLTLLDFFPKILERGKNLFDFPLIGPLGGKARGVHFQKRADLHKGFEISGFRS